MEIEHIILIVGYILFLGASFTYIGLTVYEIWAEKKLDKKDWFLKLFESVF